MTELKLSHSEVPTPESIRREQVREERRVFAAGGLATAVIVGLLITLLFEFGGCSRKHEATSSANQNSSNQIASSSTPVVPATEASSSVATSQPAKKPAKLLPSTLTYKDSTYGVSFRYPRRYTLKTGDQLNGSDVNAKSVETKTVETKSDSPKSSDASSMGSVQPKGDGEKVENHSELQGGLRNDDELMNGSGVQSINDTKPNGGSAVESQAADSNNVEVTRESESSRNLETRNIETGFVQPGGFLLARVEMPTSSYRKTDFAGGFFSVSVNRNSSAEECEQFNFIPSEPAVQSNAQPGAAPLTSPSDGQSARFRTQIRGMEFTEMDRTIDGAPIATDAKYYRLFQNGACYEFVLGLQTDGSKDGVVPVDREAVFSRLEKILATVKVKPASAPELKSSSDRNSSAVQQIASAHELPKPE